MKPLYKKLLKLAASDQGKTEKEILAQWNSDRPHFGGAGPHRMQATTNDYVKTKSKETVCVYCLKPEGFNDN